MDETLFRSRRRPTPVPQNLFLSSSIATPQKIKTIFVACAVVWAGDSRPGATETEAKARHAVGVRVVEVRRAEGTIPVAVWYPADLRQKLFGATRPRANAPFKEGRWPLFVFSHGFSGGGTGQSAITAGLAARGWIVAAPDHSDKVMAVRIHGKADGDLRQAMRHLKNEAPFTREAYAYRPRELTAVLEALLDSAMPIDRARVALGGHSMGGWTAMTVLLEDTRAKAGVFYSIGELNWLSGKRFFEAEELRRLAVPTLYVYGSQEKKINRRGPYALFCQTHSSPPSEIVEIPGGNHFVYNDRSIAPGSGGNTAQIRRVIAETLDFLERHTRAPRPSGGGGFSPAKGVSFNTE